MDKVDLATSIVKKAKLRGADECDCLIEMGTEIDIKVRKGEIESIEQSNFCGIGIRFFINRSLGFSFTTDFSEAAIHDAIEQARAFAINGSPDPASGIESYAKPEALEIYDSKIDDTPLAKKIDMALACEQAAYDFDSRIKNTYGASYSDHKVTIVLASDKSEPIGYSATRFDLTCVPVAEQNGEKRMGMWLSTERFLDELEPPPVVGSTAAQRAIQMLGARPIKTQKASVAFDPRTGAEVVENIFASVNGENILKGMSFLKDRRGQKVGTNLATFVDDGKLPRRVGSRPFDAEGIPTRRTICIDKGIVKSYLYDVRSARKAGARSTGNARRGSSSIPSVGANNFYLIPGKASRDEIIANIGNGILITNLLGFGVNITTGDFSRGAEGLWINNGRIIKPVDGITIAGNLLKMLSDIEAVGSDLRFFGRIGSPTFVITEMTIAGD